MRPYCGAPYYRVSRRSRYHGLTQIQSYAWDAALTLTRAIGYCLRSLGRYLAPPPVSIYLLRNVLFDIDLAPSGVFHTSHL